jgi:hypothetical protein
MPDPVLIEEPVQIGEGGRLSGVLTFPCRADSDRTELPVFVFINAGLVHRVGPYRLYVLLARDLSRIGIHSLRIDLAGKGDSPARPGLNRRQSLPVDYEEIVRGLEKRLGHVRLVLAGLCSGSDDAIWLAPNDARIVGLLLLDPICFRDRGFRTRAFFLNYGHVARYTAWLKRRLKMLIFRPREDDARIDPMTIRETPTLEELRSAFGSVRERKGRVLSVFTEYALPFYNQAGQLGRILEFGENPQWCTELFWPETEHTYELDLHRRRLIDTVRNWAGGFARPPQADP